MQRVQGWCGPCLHMHEYRASCWCRVLSVSWAHFLASGPKATYSPTHCTAAEYKCKLGNASRLAYPSVVAGGSDACTIHYSRKDKV